MGPSAAADPEMRQWLGRYQRLSASPGAAATMIRWVLSIDVRDVLGAVRVPTLVLTRADDQFLRSGHGRYLAEHIPSSSFRRVAGAGLLLLRRRCRVAARRGPGVPDGRARSARARSRARDGDVHRHRRLHRAGRRARRPGVARPGGTPSCGRSTSAQPVPRPGGRHRRRRVLRHRSTAPLARFAAPRRYATRCATLGPRRADRTPHR